MTGRAGRRRRVLQDGMQSMEPDLDEANAKMSEGIARRYAGADSGVGFALARRFMPTGTGALLAVAFAFLLATSALLAGGHYYGTICQTLGVASAPALDLANPMSLAKWFASMQMMAATGATLVLFGLRRKRTDDVRGLYRWWLGCVVLGVVASACHASGLHVTLAQALASQTGWSPLPHDLFWRLTPAMLLGALLAFRPLLDLKESRGAVTALVAAALLGVVATVAACVTLPAPLQPHAALLHHGAFLLTISSVLLALLAYVRHILVEVDRMTPRASVVKEDSSPRSEKTVPSRSKPSTTRKKPASPTVASKTTSPTAQAKASTTRTIASASRTKAESAAQARKSTTDWVDGSGDDMGDDYGEEATPRRRLTKAERKRLRKLKSRGQAA